MYDNCKCECHARYEQPKHKYSGCLRCLNSHSAIASSNNSGYTNSVPNNNKRSKRNETTQDT